MRQHPEKVFRIMLEKVFVGKAAVDAAMETYQCLVASYLASLADLVRKNSQLYSAPIATGTCAMLLTWHCHAPFFLNIRRKRRMATS